MKTIFFKTTLFLFLIAVNILPAKLSAQIAGCTYDIINLANCDITVDYTIYNAGTFCSSTTGLLLVAGQVHTIPCADISGCGPGPWDVEVTIVTYDGIPVTTPQTVISTNAGPLSWGPCAGGVAPNCCAFATFMIDWTPTQVTIQ